jgi:protein SCO1/2
MKKLITLFLLLLSLTACDQKSTLDFKNTDVTGLSYATDFSLPDFNGKLRHLTDFKGKVVLMFFGYTQCPDVCPTTMAELATVMRELGPLADQVQVIFVSLDPERDTAKILAQYVPAFDKRFLGLVGDEAATRKFANDFKIFYQKVPGKTPETYTVDHSSGSYVFDKEGRIRLFVRFNEGPEPIVHDLKLLLQS